MEQNKDRSAPAGAEHDKGTQLITVEIGRGQWVHAMYAGSHATLCGKTKNIRGSSEDRATCETCLRMARWAPMEAGDSMDRGSR